MLLELFAFGGAESADAEESLGAGAASEGL